MFRRNQTEEDSTGNKNYASVLFVIKAHLSSYFTSLQKYFKRFCVTR